jgi:hypothetical protein
MAHAPKNPLTLLKAVEVYGGNDVDEIGEVFRDLGSLGRLLGLVPVVFLLGVVVKVVVFPRPGGKALRLHQNLNKRKKTSSGLETEEIKSSW